MNVALAGVKLPPKRQLSVKSNKDRKHVASPTTSSPSPTSPFARSPERTTEKKVGFDFGTKASSLSRAATLPDATATTEPAKPDTEHPHNPRPHSPEIKVYDDVTAPVVINVGTWVRPTLQADTEGQDDESSPISPFAVKTAEVRSCTINWSTYLQSQLITQDHFDCIFIMEMYGKQKRDHLINNHGAQCARLLVEMALNISQPAPVQYILTLIDDFLQEDRNRVIAFHQYAAVMKQGAKGWSLFLPFLNRPDPFIVQQASRIIAKLSCWSKELMTSPELQLYLIFLKQQLCSAMDDYRQTTARCLQMMLRIEQYRFAFVEVDGLPTILTALEHIPNFQLHYQLVFCLWCLSFNPDLAEKFQKYNAIKVLAKILEDSQKEKVTRVVLATLRNLLDNPMEDELAQENALTMIHTRVLTTLGLLLTRKFADEDVLEDIHYLTDQLEGVSANLSSCDQYVAELKSGALEWSPVHKSEQFWRENVTRFNEANYELLKILVRLLEVSKDTLILCVAVHDIGQYIRYYPQGKKVLERLGGKDRAMAMLAHEDPNVRYQALLAVQKMMVQNWEFLGRRLDQDGGRVE